MTAILGGRPEGLTSVHFDDVDLDTRSRLVVVGNGMAGARFVEEVLERGGGEQFRITVFGDEPHGNYNRIMLSPVLAGEEHEDDIVLNSHDWYVDNGISLKAGVRAERIDTAAKLVYGADGTATPYDHLVLATGSYSFIPPMTGVRTDDGELLPGVYGFRTIDETRAMLDAVGRCKRAVVMGGGLLGLEAARALQGHGLQVELVHAMPYLMNMQLDPEAGAILKRSVESLGISVHLDVFATEVFGSGHVAGVGLADGRRLDADLLVVAAGVRPHTDIAVRSGLEVERGIVVDDQLRTDDPDVYAIGECAQHRGELYGLVAPAWEHAKVLADVLTGTDPTAEYHGSRTATKLKVAGVDVATMGINTPERDDDEFLVISEPKRGVHLSVVIRDDKLIGATLLGDTRKVAFLTQAFDRGLALPEERIKLLVDLSDGAAEVGVAEMPAESQVCNCNGVTKGAICGAVAGGCGSVGEVMDATRAGKGCGSCKSLVKQIVEWAADGDLKEDLAASWYVPGIPMAKPELMAAIRSQDLRSVSAVFAALAPGGTEDAKSKMGLTSLLKMLWGVDFLPEKDGEFINDRVHANIQRDGTFSVVPQMKGGVTTPGAAAEDRRRRREVRGADGEDHRRPADRPARRPQGGPPRHVGRPRHAVGLRVRQEHADREDLRRLGLLPLRSRRLHPARHRPRVAVPGDREPGEDEARRRRLSPQLRRGLREGRRCRRRRQRQVGGLRGGRRRRLGAQGRPAGHRGFAGGGAHPHRPVHAVLPRERQLAGAHLRLRAAGRARAPQGGAPPGQRGHHRRPRRGHPEVDRRLHRSVGPGREATGDAGAVPAVAAADRPADGAGPMSISELTTGGATTTAVTVGRVEEIPLGEGRTFVVDGTQVAVFRLRDGSLHATQAACPHAGGPLADGQTDVNVLVCPLHLYAYRWADGVSTNGAKPIRVYPVREVDGAVVVDV